MSQYANAVAQRLQAAFEPARNASAAAAMSAYMRNLFPFLGIPSPQRVQLQRAAAARLPKPTETELREAGRALWELPEREYQYAALDLLGRNAKLLSAESLPFVLSLITTKSWWDTVDTLASHVVGGIVLRHPQLRTEMDAWAADSNFWVARSAILHQLRYKERTDADRLFRYCELLAGETEFFIRKAIGWALREYSKTNAEAVREFVAANEATLSGLSKREALLWLNGGRRGTRTTFSAVPGPGTGPPGSLPRSGGNV